MLKTSGARAGLNFPLAMPEIIMSNKALVRDLVDEHKTDFCALSDRIWGMPEIYYT